MRLTFFGQSGFRIEAGDAVLLVDPWLRGNPVFDESRFDEAVNGATHILATHGHFDHAADIPEIAKQTGATVAGIVEYADHMLEAHGIEAVKFNMGGTIDCGGVAVTMVRASHSSSVPLPDGKSRYVGTEASFMLAHGGMTLYHMGDTDVHADMAIYQDLHAPDYAIVPVGGHFTMDAKRAAYACKKFFKLKAAIASHFGTFPLLTPTADDFVAEMSGSGTDVIVPEVMVPFEI